MLVAAMLECVCVCVCVCACVQANTHASAEGRVCMGCLMHLKLNFTTLSNDLLLASISQQLLTNNLLGLPCAL